MNPPEATGRPRRRRRRLHRALISPDSYGSVLVLLLISYSLSVALTQPWQRSIILFVQIGVVSLTLRVSQARRWAIAFSTVMLVIAGGVAIVTAVTGGEGDLSTAIVFLTSSVLYFVAPLSILRSIVLQQEVDQETVLGAVDAYLFVGMFFAYAYQAIGALDPPMFEGGGNATVAETLFFSFTTLTTTGYGNLVPAGDLGQTVAVAEMLTGQLFLVTAVAKVITVWRPARWRAGGGGPGSTPDNAEG
jgi:voltage-gated potassium channel Kch